MRISARSFVESLVILEICKLADLLCQTLAAREVGNGLEDALQRILKQADAAVAGTARPATVLTRPMIMIKLELAERATTAVARSAKGRRLQSPSQAR